MKCQTVIHVDGRKYVSHKADTPVDKKEECADALREILSKADSFQIECEDGYFLIIPTKEKIQTIHAEMIFFEEE